MACTQIRKRLINNLLYPHKNDAWKNKKSSLFFLNDKLVILKIKLGNLKNKASLCGHTNMIL
jgi:hypothetical protein